MTTGAVEEVMKRIGDALDYPHTDAADRRPYIRVHSVDALALLTRIRSLELKVEKWKSGCTGRHGSQAPCVKS